MARLDSGKWLAGSCIEANTSGLKPCWSASWEKIARSGAFTAMMNTILTPCDFMLTTSAVKLDWAGGKSSSYLIL